MKNNFWQELLISGILILLLLLFLNPFHFWMPPTLVMMMILGLVLLFIFFAGFIWREDHRDERESLHKMMAGRNAFLAGILISVAGIIVQSFSHKIDPWLIFTVGTMIMVKIGALTYGRMRH